MDATNAVMDAENGTITPWYGVAYGYTFAWTGVGRGVAALWVGDHNGPCFIEDEFLVHAKAGGELWVEWLQARGHSRWRPNRDEDELDYVPRPDAEVWEALERLIVEGHS